MKTVMISLYDEPPIIDALMSAVGAEKGKIVLRDFPDGETYVKFESSLQDRELIVLSSLDRPNNKILPLLFVAKIAKEMGVERVGLCAPYLAYMRQDKKFHEGEGVTSSYFASLLSGYFDWLVTVDPHLHRYHDLGEIYSIPNTVLHAASEISHWISKKVKNPVLIGPDLESEQWVSKVAKEAGAPFIILEKIRHGDRDVEVSYPEITPYLDFTPVLVDDIISTARTMIETVNHLKELKMKPPICIGVHAVFADDAYESLLQSGVEKVVTCNSIFHPSNEIDLSNILRDGIFEHLNHR